MLPEPLRCVFLVYFATHVPVTLCIDAQPLLASLGVAYPEALQALLRWHCAANDDFLMRSAPAWFLSLLAVEIVAQLPFFFVALYGLAQRRAWVRAPLIAYGAHVATTLVPILGAFLAAPVGDGDGSFRSEAKRWVLIAIYAPYFLVPMLIAAAMGLDAAPFGPPPKAKKQA
uniref:EXPERA domain-containing protein n=1 Tax=Phaeomonas parva TaxID=124430 RepID=A0A6U4K9D7_9STRA|mmetsp:Transcript_46689/g.145817  ORF Transcript_46689/g.145817 Transcript_46689/m.145817 type:complete len:172 (+) Transcript_46689:152-667(+)